MTSVKRTQRKYVQKAYRVRNWREYETGLRARGSLTVWLGLTDGKLANWNSPRPTRRTPGRQRQYSNHAIETTVTLGLVFGLASRQTEGFLRSLLTLLNLDNDVPDHSTISRRKARLGKVASYERRTVKPVHLLIDSSGLSVHVGQLRTPPKARDYRKLHLAVDEHTSDVVACELTSKRARDASRVASLVGQIERPIASAKADAAYDTGDVYKTLENHRAHRSPKVLIPPRTGAQLALDSAGTRQRNRNIRARSRIGKRKWYVASGYSRRSKVETTFHRYKAILGSAMRARGCLGAQLAISVNNCPPPRDPRSRMTSVKRTQRKDVQKAYRVRNWREYETGLRARGSLTVWLGLTDGKLANWNSPRPTRRTPGRQRQYSNHAIETTVTLGLVFGLASRQPEGFLRSLLTLLNLDNDVPDHSTISRRKARLGKGASYERRTVKPVHLLIDSSGLSVHVGQLRTPPKARDYRKLHLAVDEHTSDVVACELTSKRARDASRVASLVGQIERPIASAKADAAYDTGDVYKTLENHRAHRSPKVLIPPRTGAQLALDSAGTRQRTRNIRARSRVGKRKWYVASGYSRRSKVETTFHRYKAILGSAMRARGLASQRVEVRLGCKILNTMTALGIPDGEMIG